MAMEDTRPAPLLPAVPRPTRKLTDGERWLLDVMRKNQFGRIENLRVQRGQPTPDQNLRIIRTARLGGKDGENKVSIPDESELKKMAWALFHEVRQLGDGVVLRLEFRRGLPFLLETTTSPGNEINP